jgi:hypothetical protein
VLQTQAHWRASGLPARRQARLVPQANMPPSKQRKTNVKDAGNARRGGLERPEAGRYHADIRR